MFVCHDYAELPRHNGCMAKARSKKKVTKPSRSRAFADRSRTSARTFWSSYGRFGATVLGIAVGVATAFSLVVIPVRDFVTQRAKVAEKSAEFEALADANEALQIEINKLSTPDGIRHAAREQLGYVLPGEQRLSLVKMPDLPTELPGVWPYTLVTDIVKVRMEVAANARGEFSTKGP